jgi:hypothetical protein
MKRREFVGMSARIVGALAARPLLNAQPSKVRAAVVIGVDKAGGLPTLHGAASGAQQVADWLRSERFAITLFVDGAGAVRVNDIYDAIAARVNSGTLDQLVVYFAGHGFISNYSEYWMLSNAPANPNEAVSLRESIELARVSGIPNVVFISDACRSRADSLGTERVRGSLIFPNQTGSPTPADVDVFLATLVGDSSFEVPVGTSVAQYEGIYTAAFLNAFTRPDDTMVSTIDGVRVVPNNRLKLYLEREVRTRLEAISIRRRQIPDTQVVSGDSTYIGRVTSTNPPIHVTPTEQPASLHDLAAVDFARIGIRGGTGSAVASADAISRLRNETGYSSANQPVLADARTATLGNGSGFAVTGARVTLAVSRSPMRTETLSSGDGQGEPALVRVEMGDPRTRAGSVALQFADGGGTVLAALNGFVGHVVVNEQRVVNVSYVPSRGSDRWFDYNAQRARIDDLHAVVATAARFGVFRIEPGRENRARSAAQLADRIRLLKGIDPTLGLYAAYAYSDAGLPGQIRSVRGIMRGDLGADLFDVAMLSGELTGRNLDGAAAAFPFSPMLSQGWSLLRVKDVRLPRDVTAARDHLRESLWTTFDREGLAILIGALREGRLR